MKIITIKIGKAQGIAELKKGKIRLHKYPKSVTDLKILLMGMTDNEKVIVCVERVTLSGIRYMPYEAQQARKRMFREFQLVLSTLIDLNLAFMDVTEKEWVRYLGLHQDLEEAKDRKKRIGNAAVHWFGGIVEVSRWNHKALLILRFMVLKSQTDMDWINARIIK